MRTPVRDPEQVHANDTKHGVSHILRAPTEERALCGYKQHQAPGPVHCTRRNRCVVCLDLWDAMNAYERAGIYLNWGIQPRSPAIWIEAA